MFSVIIAVLVGIALGATLTLTEVLGLGWSIFLGVLVALGTQLGLGFALKKTIMGRMNAIQGIIQQGQMKLQRQVQIMQSRPMGSVKQAQKMLEKEQRKFIEEALAATKTLEPFFKWSLLLDRQVATMRMQFLFQLQEWSKVDALMPKCMFLEPMTASMKMVRMYKLEKDGIDAFYAKTTKRLRYGQGTTLYALYSWILVQQGKIEEATKVLLDAKKQCDSPVIAKNWEHLANNRTKQFSNAAIGDEWYALGLETPKVNVRRQRQRGGFRQY